MPADPPISNNNNKNTDETTDLPGSNSLNISETPSIAKGDNNLDSDSTTSTDITLTLRQQRALAYLARRRMRKARITIRQTYADIIEATHNNDNEPTPDPHENNNDASSDHGRGDPLWSPSSGSPSHFSGSPSHFSGSPLNEDLDGQALYSPWNGGLTRDPSPLPALQPLPLAFQP